MHWFAAVLSAAIVVAATSIAAAQETQPAHGVSVIPAVSPSDPATRGAATQPAVASGPTSFPAYFPDAGGMLRQLSDPDWHQRRTARETLIRLGEEGKPFIQDLIRRATDEEAKQQAQAALALIDENRVLGPSYLTLHVKNAGPAEIFADISRQCLAPLPTMPENLWAQGNFPRLTMDVDRRPFWEVVPNVCQQFGVDFRQFQTNLRLMRTGGNQLLGLSHPEGAFLVVADRIVYSRTRILGANRREVSSFGMNLIVYPEPKITLLRGTTTLHLIEVTDDQHNSLVPPNSDRGISSGSFGGSVAAQLYAPLQYPKHNPGSKIVKFRANAAFSVQTKVQQIQISDVLKVKDYVVNVRGIGITFREIRQKQDNYELRLTVVEANPALGFRDIYDQVQTRLRLLDSRGNELLHRGMTTSPNGNGIDITLEFSGAPPAQIPDKLLWEIPIDSRQIIVPINFDDIPLFSDD